MPINTTKQHKQTRFYFLRRCFVSSITAKILLLDLTVCYIWVTRQELFTLREHLGSRPVFWWDVLLICFVLSYYVSLRSEFRVVVSVTNSTQKWCSVLYLCFLAYSGVQHLLCYVYVSFFLVLCILCCQFLWIVHFWLPLRYSLTLIWW